ncbi:hypothetical protein L7F22_050083 [Adiantum nelumboides]|nr:hypothetical protein [Adiantum nelumboides]
MMYADELSSFSSGFLDTAPCPLVYSPAEFPKQFTNCLHDYWAAKKREQRERERQQTLDGEKRKDVQLDEKQKRKIGCAMSRIIPTEADIDEDVSSDEEIDAPMYVGHHNDLSDVLCVGDNCALNAEEEDFDFDILRCCMEKRGYPS